MVVDHRPLAGSRSFARGSYAPEWGRLLLHCGAPSGKIDAARDYGGAVPTQSLQRAESGSQGDRPSTDYESMTKPELYDLAKERDVPGRASLSKAELIEALRHQDEPADVA